MGLHEKTSKKIVGKIIVTSIEENQSLTTTNIAHSKVVSKAYIIFNFQE
jgi:hypothetical protein